MGAPHYYIQNKTKTVSKPKICICAKKVVTLQTNFAIYEKRPTY